MPFDPNPSAGELALREQQLRDEIMGRTGLGGEYRSRATSAAPHTQTVRTPVDPVPPEARLDLDPEMAALLGVNLSSGQVLTTLGRFELTEIENAQISAIAVVAIQRNLQDMLNAMEERHGVLALRAAVEAQQAHERAETRFEAQAAAKPIRVIEHASKPGDSAMDEFVAEMRRAPVPKSAPDAGDEIDEENDLPPVPLGRSIPKTRRRK